MQSGSDANSAANAWRSGEWLLLPAQRRLLRNGKQVAVDERVFDLVALLIVNYENILSQREITARLWGPRPVSDNTLRQLVYKARRALGDDGERQTLIRTLPGRGLQWVTPVEAVSVPEPQAVAHRRSAMRNRRVLLWTGLAALVLVVLAGLWSRNARAPLDEPIQRIAIEPIDNITGDKTLDWTSNGLPGLLAGLLSQGGGVDVVDPLQVARAWKYQPRQGRSPEQQLRFATGADVLVGGHLRKVTDNLYELHLRVESASRALAQITLTGVAPATLAVDAVARIRGALKLDGPITPDRLPTDTFLAAAYARGMDFATHGKWDDAREYFLLCTKGAPEFLPAALNLGMAQARTNAIPEGEKTLREVAAQAAAQGDALMRGHALLRLGYLARGYDDEEPASGYLRQAATVAKANGDARTEMEARALLADVLHKLQKPEPSRHEMHMAEALAAQHPELVMTLPLLFSVQSSIAGDEGDQQGSLAAARSELDLSESLGNERGTVTSMFNMALPLRSMHRDAESLALSSRCYQRAVADNLLGMQFACAANFGASLLDLGLARPAIHVADLLAPIALRVKSAEYQVLALQLRSMGEMEQGDFASALADLHKGDALTDVSKLAYGTFLDQEIYEATAAFKAAPHEVAALIERFDAVASEHMTDAGYAQRRATLRALAAAMQHRHHDALANLREAAAAPALAADGSFEIRMAPLLIALAGHDQRAADIALNGYDPATTNDAGLLPLVIQWAHQQGDANGAARAQIRLAALRRQGRNALIAAGLDPDHPLGGV